MFFELNEMELLEIDGGCSCNPGSRHPVAGCPMARFIMAVCMD